MGKPMTQIYRYVIEDRRHVPPFNEPASQLTIGLKELKIHQEDLFSALFSQDMSLGAPLRSRARGARRTGLCAWSRRALNGTTCVGCTR